MDLMEGIFWAIFFHPSNPSPGKDQITINADEPPVHRRVSGSRDLAKPFHISHTDHTWNLGTGQKKMHSVLTRKVSISLI